MKKIVCIVVLLLGLQSFGAFSQELSMQDATLARYSKFYPKTYSGVNFKPNSPDFSHLVDYKEIVLCAASKNYKGQTILTLDQLQSALDAYAKNIKLNYLPYYHTWLSVDKLSFQYSDDRGSYFFVYNTKTKKIESLISLPDDASEPLPNADFSKVAYNDGRNVFVIDNKGNSTQITFSRNPKVVNGVGYVHRQEFGINVGMFWSPDGSKLAFYQKDESSVANYPLVNTATRIAEANNIAYPMAGEKSENVKLLSYDFNTKQTTTMNTTGPADQYLTSITWGPNSNEIFIGILNRGQDHLVLKSYDATTGAEKATFFEEKASTYVEPLHPLIFEEKLKDGFVYQSEKDGFNALYFVKNDGSSMKFLGKEGVVVEEYLGFDAKTSNFYYIGADNNGLDRQLYAVNLKSAETKKITKKSGVYSVTISPDFTKAFFTFSNITTPTITGVLDIKTGNENQLIVADNPYTQITMPKVELVTITAADGKTPLNGRIIYPTNFDPNKKYPMVLYVYGGPHAQMITNSLNGGAPLWDIHMAQQGYIMFTLDNRGSDARGKDFEHVIHRQLGVNEMADQMKGVEFMKSKPFVDAERIGVYGWSFGGFMTISLLLEHSDVFKVGVAGGPVCDWKYYEIMYGERYMDTPQENPDGYEKTSVIKKADKLNSKLLVIHGAQDDVVVMQHSMEFINACIKKGKQVDYFLYPDHKHNVSGKDRVHLNTKIANYFHDYLRK